MLPEIASQILGYNRGQQEMSGIQPSGQNVGGAAGTPDFSTPFFDQCHDSLMSLSSMLNQQRQVDDANRVAKLAVTLREIQISRAKNMAEDMGEQALTGRATQAMSQVGGMNAMGVPQGGM